MISGLFLELFAVPQNIGFLSFSFGATESNLLQKLEMEFLPHSDRSLLKDTTVGELQC